MRQYASALDKNAQEESTMQDKNELQEFDLDDILSEFQDLPEDDASGDLTDILGDWAEEAPAPVQEPGLTHVVASLKRSSWLQLTQM